MQNAIRNKHLSFSIKSAYIFYVFLSLLLLGAVSLVSLFFGAEDLSFSDTMTALGGVGDPAHSFIVRNLRLPRTISALIGGGLMALSGSLIQLLVKNPLASPDLIGISSGGIIGIFVYLSFFSFLPYNFLPLFSFLGCVMALHMLLIITGKQTKRLSFILKGVAIATILQAVITGVMLLSNDFTGETLYLWTVGSTYASSWAKIEQLAIFLPLLLLLFVVNSRALNSYLLPDEVVVSLGVDVKKSRTIYLYLATFSCALALPYLGGVAFVGLIAPHIVKRFVSSSYSVIMIMSFMVGGILTIIADTLGRAFYVQYEYPLGVFMALIGAPYFLFILYKKM